MSNALLAQLDARLHAAFLGAGMADVGEYRTAANAAGVEVRVMLDRSRALQGAAGQGSYTDNTLTLLKQPGLQPRAGHLVDISGERFELRSFQGEDEGAWVFAVRSGPVPPPPAPEPEPEPEPEPDEEGTP
jgi:hypothetical protein